MGKSISYLYRYAEISKAANLRLLSALVNIIPQKSIEAEINKICEIYHWLKCILSATFISICSLITAFSAG
ncbi:MAG: hypothetical protein WCD89_20870 [Anaerocolumna sp.]